MTLHIYWQVWSVTLEVALHRQAPSASSRPCWRWFTFPRENLYIDRCRSSRTSRVICLVLKNDIFSEQTPSMKNNLQSIVENVTSNSQCYTGTCLFYIHIHINAITLLWRHNGRYNVSNHQPHECLLNRLFRRRSKKTSKLRVTGLCVGNSSGTGEFPTQMASSAVNVPIWRRHHDTVWMRSHKDPHRW